MRVDFGLQQAKVSEKERLHHLRRVVRAAVTSCAVGGAGLVFGFGAGLHDARWAGAWTVVGEASSLLGAPGARDAALAVNTSHPG